MDWPSFSGGVEALRYARRDLPMLDEVIRLASSKTAVVQAGGNLGVFPKYLAQHFGTVYTFEPSPELFRVLCENAPERNIVRLQAAVGDGPRLVRMSQTRRTKTHKPPHEGVTHVAGDGVIPTLRIDDLGLPVCDAIQLDVEGYELAAIRGARETIRRCHPVIAVEVNDNLQHYGVTRNDLWDELGALGYVLSLRRESDEVYVPARRRVQ